MQAYRNKQCVHMGGIFIFMVGVIKGSPKGTNTVAGGLSAAKPPDSLIISGYDPEGVGCRVPLLMSWDPFRVRAG